MRFRPVSVLILSLLIAACSKETSVATSSTSSSDPTTTETTATPIAPAAGTRATTEDTDLLAISSGTVLVQPPENQGWLSGRMGPFNMFNDMTTDVWTSPIGKKAPQTAIIEFPARTTIETFVFDTAPARDGAVRAVKAEISDSGPKNGFQPLGTFNLAESQDGQRFDTTAKIAGRWLRFTFEPHESKESMSLGNVKAYGEQSESRALADVSGTYSFDEQLPWNVQQDGASVTGCYAGNYEGRLSGGVEGNVIKLRWSQNNGESGPMFINVASDGQGVVFRWKDGQSPAEVAPDIYYGRRTSTEIGSCGHWKPRSAFDDALASQLEKGGRAIVYGINFDTDSATIRTESHAVLDKLVGLMRAKPEWKLSIEGHTDSTASAAHNQQLSEARAASVRRYLVDKGVAAERLTSAGRGAGSPVAPNDTATGRAQNRRVELVKV